MLLKEVWFYSVLCSVNFASSVLGNHAQVSFFSFISGATVKPTPEVFVRHEQLLRSDDSPFQRFPTPYQFNLLGVNVNELFISPNGALHYSIEQPCPAFNAFATSSCTFKNAYYNVIGGYLVDLNPSTSRNGSITSFIGLDSFTIQYTNIAYYDSFLDNDFRISVYRDSHIELSYDRLNMTSEFPSNGLWSSGLRGSLTNPYAYFDDKQRQTGSALWGMNVAGIYPDPSDVISGNQFNICPVSRQWCITPSVLSRVHAENFASNLLLTSQLLSCTALVEFGIIIVSGDEEAHSSSDQQWELLCDVIGNISISCNLTELLLTVSVDNMVLITPAWRIPNNESEFSALPVDGIPIRIVDALYNVTSGGDRNIAVGCANNANITACGGASSCAICDRNYSCFDLPCAKNTTDSASAIFTRPTCANDTCPIFNASSESTYYTDYEDQCCMLSEMDCSGQCGGPAVVALYTDGSVTCCPGYATVDCAGVCDGPAQRDACGTCQGTDSNAIGCFNTSDVVISTESDDNIFHPVYDALTKDGLRRQIRGKVKNKSPFRILVFFSEVLAAQAQAPEVFIPGGETPVEANETFSFAIDTSIELLYIGNMSSWTTKQINVRFKRSIYAEKVYDNLIPVYPATVNCSNVTDRSTCMRLPACIFCFTEMKMRILRGTAAESTGTPTAMEQAHGQGSEYGEAAAERRLFIEVVPQAVTDPGDNLGGVCGDGWSNQDCAVIAPHAFAFSAAVATTARSVLFVNAAAVALSILYLFCK